MRKSIFALLVLAISLFGTQCWAQGCVTNEGGGITCTFSPTTTTHTYNFGTDGTITVRFTTVLTTFTLTVTVDHNIDGLAPNVFPVGTMAVTYCNNQKAEYDFSGNKLGPNGVPVKGTDYLGLINIQLGYCSFQTANKPAFLHAPGDNATAVYTEDILRRYSSYPPCPGETSCNNVTITKNTNNTIIVTEGDPTMCGDTPGLSTLAAFDEPLAETDCFQWVSPTENQVFTAGQEIEVAFKLFHGTTCAGDPIRDKDAGLSLSRVDNGHLAFVRIGKDEGGNHFHFDNENGVNEREVETERLQSGTYIITVFSSEFSVKNRTVQIQ